MSRSYMLNGLQVFKHLANETVPINATENNFHSSLKLRVALKKHDFYSFFQIIHLPIQTSIRIPRESPIALTHNYNFLSSSPRSKQDKITHKRTKYCGVELLLILLMVVLPCLLLCYASQCYVLLELPVGLTLQGLNSFRMESVRHRILTSYWWKR